MRGYSKSENVAVAVPSSEEEGNQPTRSGTQTKARKILDTTLLAVSDCWILDAQTKHTCDFAIQVVNLRDAAVVRLLRNAEIARGETDDGGAELIGTARTLLPACNQLGESSTTAPRPSSAACSPDLSAPNLPQARREPALLAEEAVATAYRKQVGL